MDIAGYVTDELGMLKGWTWVQPEDLIYGPTRLSGWGLMILGAQLDKLICSYMLL